MSGAGGERPTWPMSAALVVSCEHGGNAIPAEYSGFFADQQALLATHRGYDAGALAMARSLATVFAAPLVFSEISRLLVDLNRSKGHPGLHFDAIRRAPARLREEILATHYEPYRAEAERLVMSAVAAGKRVVTSPRTALHPISTAGFDCRCRPVYDPARAEERALCARWKMALGEVAPALVVRRNYPYAGRGRAHRVVSQALAAGALCGCGARAQPETCGWPRERLVRAARCNCRIPANDDRG